MYFNREHLSEVKEAMLKQGQPSYIHYSDGTISEPQYHTPHSTCPIGHYIDEKYYHVSMEGEDSMWPQIVNAVEDTVGQKLELYDLEFLNDLQLAHDRFFEQPTYLKLMREGTDPVALAAAWRHWVHVEFTAIADKYDAIWLDSSS